MKPVTSSLKNADSDDRQTTYERRNQKQFSEHVLFDTGINYVVLKD